MKKAAAVFVLTVGMILILLLTSCGVSQQDSMATAIAYTQTFQAPTPMPDVLNFAVAVEQARATGLAIEATQVWIYGQLTATQVAKEDEIARQNAVATVRAAEVTRQAFAVRSTAEHELFVAEQMATERSFYATGTSQVQGTMTAYPQTATAQSNHATQTQQAWQTTATMDAAYGSAQATAASGNSESVVLSLERERSTNMTKAWLPWMAFAVVIGLITVMGIRWSKVRVIARDPFGALPGLVIGGDFKDPDRLPGPDASVTERAQYVQAVRALPAGRSELPELPSLGRVQPLPIDVVEPDSVRPWLEDVTRQADEEI